MTIKTTIIGSPEGALLMRHDSGPEGAVYILQGTNATRDPMRKIQDNTFKFDDKCWTIIGVYSPDVREGSIFFVVLARCTAGIAAFTLVHNTYYNHAQFVSDGAGGVDSTGLIPIMDPMTNAVMKPSSAVYDETLGRLVYETTQGAPAYADMSLGLFTDAVPTYITANGVDVTDVMYAYRDDGDVSAIYAASEGEYTVLYDPQGAFIARVEAVPASRYGLRSPTAVGDDFDLIVYVIDGTYLVQNVDSSAPGDIVGVWLTSSGSSNSSYLQIMSVDGESRIITQLEIIKKNTAVIVYTPTNCTEYDAETLAINSSVAAPTVRPFSAVAIPGGHLTVGVDTTILSDPLVVYTTYDESGAAVASYPFQMDSQDAHPEPSNKLVRTAGGYGFGGSFLAKDLSEISYDAIEWHVEEDGWIGTYKARNGAVRAEHPGFNTDISEPFDWPATVDPRIQHFIPQDDMLGGLAYRRAAPTVGGDPQHSLELVVLTKDHLVPFSVKVLIAETPLIPGPADIMEYGGDRFLCMLGNPLSGTQDVVCVFRIDDFETATPTLVLMKEEAVPANKTVESLRAEGDTLVWTEEPSEDGATYSLFARSSNSLDPSDQVSSIANIWEPAGAQVIPAAGDIEMTNAFAVPRYGRYAVYVTIENVGVAGPIPVTVGSTVASVPEGESLIYFVGYVAKNLLTYDTGTDTVVGAASRLDDLFLLTAFDAPAVVPASTLASIFLTGGAVAHVTARNMTNWSLHGKTIIPEARVRIYSRHTDTLGQIILTSTVDAIVVIPAEPEVVMIGATFL